ncbi:hypothetical protein ACH42_03820 [Endozoicomonas sp. (ex Bugula neritina AB1)]|nr:hypothetical protein ACH42_03820 [Endozoicomonas sp. (ex Bugula neritina AB1)]
MKGDGYTTSADGSFNGASLAARMQNLNYRESVSRAHHMAGAVIQYKGATILRMVTEPLI